MNNKDSKEQREKSLKKEIKFMDVSIVGIFIFLFVFTCAMAYLTYSTSVEADTLIISVFGFCGLECGLMAGIQKRKTTIRSELEKLYSNKNKQSLDNNKRSQTDKPKEQIEAPIQQIDYVDNSEEDDEDYQTPVIY